MKNNTINPVLSDAQARERALDPSTSFIIQAPAGSGKTELLTQRFLVLLNHVNSPEEILAITFTKKSSNEMRARIINTLKKAAQSSVEPEQAHTKKTWRLARNVLERDAEFQWNLLANPNRLRIQTIDSFNASLTKRLPILSQFGASPEIANEPYFLYLEAVQEFLTHLEEDVEWSHAIAQLLLHMDNDLNKVQDLLITMLSKRDQWLPHISLNANDPTLRNKLENYLSDVISDALTHLIDIFPVEYADELLLLIRFASQHLVATNSKSKIATLGSLCDLPGDTLVDLPDWLAISEFLLTSESTWRKTVRVTEGFPAPGKDLHLKDMKERAIALINELSENEELRNAFEEIRSLPSGEYSDSQWNMLEALHLVLRVSVAQLRVIFQKYGKIDYIENAQAALLALGSDEAPTDIALALDYRLQHILVDEFQDTASIQYQLIEKLTAGWTPNDGRTLFVVGDPMQSIYRFREAEVGLFIRARKKGLGHIALEPLTLSVNFRSTPNVVNWVNEHFKKVLPPYEDIATGAVSYNSSIANNIKESATSSVELHPLLGENAYQDQAKKVIALIHQEKLHNPEGTISILVRTRTHLRAIIPALKNAKLAFRAIKIDPLSLRPNIQDIMALTRALLHPSDRIAWLSILRAPWCGLTLNDLLTLTGNNQNVHLWKQLQSEKITSSLSADGQKRLARILPILKEKVNERRRLSLRLWIESTWIALGGPACVAQPSDLLDVAAYFNLIEQLDVGGDIVHLENLSESVKQLYASADNEADDKLQIMTIHNAKGLEFDTVILPHLERKPSGDDKQLLLWMERPRENERSDLIIAPVHAIGEKNDSIYEYIKRQTKKKAQFEDGRLLYVAATRAKHKLHILFSLEDKKKKDGSDLKPTANSLLEKLWPAISSNLRISSSHSDAENSMFTKSNSSTDYTIQRLTSDWSNPIQEYTPANELTYHNKSSGFLLPNTKPKIIGTLLHAILQQLALHGLEWWRNKPEEQQTNYIHNQLIQSGLFSIELEEAIKMIQKGIKNILDDTRGNWILMPHSEAQSEFPLTSLIDDEVKNTIIDRTFVDKGIRWIIDYKTSIFSNDDLEKFLNSEKKKYEQQLKTYAQTIRYIDSRPIRVGLYFPMIPAWKEWEVEL
jgi:ATP-dependent helicase/nuclease subunit A